MLNVDKVDLFYGAAQALRGVSLSAQRGEVTCVLGRNGVGKTTLLRAVTGQQPVGAGHISWQGEDITALPPHQRARRGIAYVPQGARDLPAAHGPRESRDGLCAVAARPSTPFPKTCFTLFPVLKEMLRRRGGDLSGGQQQQLAIGRALVTRPKLIVLDEPTEGIQPSIIKQISAAIDYLRRSGEIAILLVEQYFDFAKELADMFFVMERGEIVLSGRGSDMNDADVRRLMSV